MPILDETLTQIVADLAPAFEAAHLTRQRGGISRGVAWAEVSGRAANGAWLELRIHHRPTEQQVQAGLLCYQPLAQGGRTLVLGEASRDYVNGSDEVSGDLNDEIRTWLRALEGDRDGRVE